MPSSDAGFRDGVMTGIWLWKAIDRILRSSASVVSFSSSFMPSCSSATPSSLMSPFPGSLNRASTSGARSASVIAYNSIIRERSFLGNWSPLAFMKWMRNLRISRNS